MANIFGVEALRGGDKVIMRAEYLAWEDTEFCRQNKWAGSFGQNNKLKSIQVM